MIRVLKESQRLAPLEWQALLGCDASALVELCSRNVLRPEGGNLTLRFVGICCLANVVCVCLPSLGLPATTGSVVDRASQLNRMLQVYLSRSSHRRDAGDQIAQDFVVDPRATQAIRKIDSLAALLRWTGLYGFHCFEHSRLGTEDYRVHWPETIKHSLFHPTRNGAIYLSPITTSVRTRLSPLGLLQARVISELDDGYGAVAEVCNSGAGEIVDEGRRLLRDEGQHCESLAWVLDEWAQQLNRDHEVELVAILRAATRAGVVPIRTSDTVALHGTTAFELVWEDMCRFALGDVDVEQLRARMANPILFHAEGSTAVDRQRPDCVFVVEERTYICDAKYYPSMPRTLPTLEDVRKQFVYGMSTRAASALVFLLPGACADGAHEYGRYRMIGDSEIAETFPEVHCVVCDWNRIVTAYVAQQRRLDLRQAVVRCTQEQCLVDATR